MSWWTDAGVAGGLLALALGLAALGAGWLARRDRTVELTLLLEQFALGCGMLGVLTLAEGALGIFVRPLLALPAGLAIVGVVQLYRSRQAWSALAPLDRFEVLAIAVMLLLFITSLLAALGPELEPDALSYHLPAAADWARSGHDPFNQSNYPTGYPLLVEGVYAWLALLGQAEGARVLHWLAMLAATLATAQLGARVAGRRTGILAATILAGVPMLAWTAQTANTESFGLLFFVLAVLRLDDHLRDGRRASLAWEAVFLGLCASTKIWNLLFVPLFAAVVFAFWLRLWRQKRARLIAAWRSAALFGGLALAVYLPWALRAFILTDDPLYPLLVPLWTRWPGQFFQGISHYVADAYGLGHGLKELLLVGWNLTFLPEHFGNLSIGWLFLPLVTFGLFRLRRYPLLRLLAPIAGIVMLVWFFTSQQVRYLAPLFPVAAVLAAAPVVAAAEKKAWRWLPVLVAVLALTGWAPLVRHQWPGAGFVPKVYASLLTGRTTRDQIREQFAYNNEWSLWRFVNGALPTGTKLFGEGAQARWWSEREFFDASYDPASVFLFGPAGRLTTEFDFSMKMATHFIVTIRREPAFVEWSGGRLCRLYTNGDLVVLETRPDSSPCSPTPLAPNEPYRWLEVASPRDPHGYWWIGARARLLLAPGQRLEIVAPFAAQGANRLTVQIADRPPTDYTIEGTRIIAPASSPAELITLTAPVTVDPLALGYTGDPSPKSFLVRIVR